MLHENMADAPGKLNKNCMQNMIRCKYNFRTKDTILITRH